MKALLITVGSRGDVEPFCALATALSSRKHEVDLFLVEDYHYLAPSSSSIDGVAPIRVHELPFSTNDFYRFSNNPSHGLDHPNPRVKFEGIIADCIGELVFPCTEKVLNTAMKSESDIIVTSSLARPLAIALSQKLGIPICIVHLQPLAPTSTFPHYSYAEQSVKAIEETFNNEEGRPKSSNPSEIAQTYWELEYFRHDFLKDRLAKVYEYLDLDPIDFEDGLKSYLMGKHDSVIVANAFSSEIVPTCPDHEGYNVKDIGDLAHDYNNDLLHKDWTPPSELSTFLEQKCKEDPPVCIGYGSMPFDKIKIVVEALESLNKKAVLVGYAFKDVISINSWVQENVIQVSDIPYSWLLPRCSMMLCHGGAGVVHATIRAGIPAVISPFFGDQFFWVNLLENKGVAIRAGSTLPEISKDNLLSAITQASEQHYKEKARQLGESIRSKPTGVDVLVEVLESKVASLGDKK